MEAVAIDVRDGDNTAAWWFLDALVVEHRVAPQMAGVVLEMTLPVGHSPALHIHETLDDTWYVIDGRMAARCGDDEFVINDGDWVSMPRGVPHTFRVMSETAVVLGVMTPGRFETIFRELGVPAARRTLPDPGTVPFDVPRVMEEQRRRGTEVVGPPM